MAVRVVMVTSPETVSIVRASRSHPKCRVPEKTRCAISRGDAEKHARSVATTRRGTAFRVAPHLQLVQVMALTTSRFCPVLGQRVTVLTDLEGSVLDVICSYHDRATSACQLKGRACTGGRLSELVERAARGRFTDRTTRCQFQ
jgi:hypothetical protein